MVEGSRAGTAAVLVSSARIRPRWLRSDILPLLGDFYASGGSQGLLDISIDGELTSSKSTDLFQLISLRPWHENAMILTMKRRAPIPA